MLNAITYLLILSLPSVVTGNSVTIKVEGENGVPIPGATVIFDKDKKIETNEQGVTKEPIPFDGKQLTVKVDPPQGSNFQGRIFIIPKDAVSLLQLTQKALPQSVQETQYQPVYECRQDSCGRCYTVVKMVPQCSSRCCMQSPCVPSTTCDCDREIADAYDSANTGEAKLTVSVPAAAQVFINDRPTKSTGTRRVYLSKGLAYGVNYWYCVRVRIVRDGKAFEEIREVVLRAGNSKSVSLDFSR